MVSYCYGLHMKFTCLLYFSSVQQPGLHHMAERKQAFKYRNGGFQNDIAEPDRH